MSSGEEQHRLVVLLNSRYVADLQRDRRGRLSLAYTEEAIETFGLGGLCLSVALPVSRQKYSHAETAPWAEGLLPEGETRTVLEREFSVRRGDVFGLLAKIGRDCAGAVAFYQPGESPDELRLPLNRLSDAELDEAIRTGSASRG